jgi:hypothetical protein
VTIAVVSKSRFRFSACLDHQPLGVNEFADFFPIRELCPGLLAGERLKSINRDGCLPQYLLWTDPKVNSIVTVQAFSEEILGKQQTLKRICRSCKIRGSSRITVTYLTVWLLMDAQQSNRESGSS